MSITATDRVAGERVIDFLLTKRETADQLETSESSVNRLLASRKLHAVKIGGQTRIKASELRRFVDEAPEAQFRPKAD